MQQTKKGFTLIELLVVIAIIGILSAIGLVSLNGARERARDAKRKSDLAQIATALTLYYDDNSSQYPITGAANNAGALYSTANGLKAVLSPTYLATFPDPETTTGNNAYWYVTNNAAMTPDTLPQYGARKLWALASQLEGGTKKVYVTNALGKTTEVTVGTSFTISGTVFECADTPSSGSIDACNSTIAVI